MIRGVSGLMSIFSRLIGRGLVAVALPAVVSASAEAQSRGQPVVFALADLSTLRFLEGTWVGEAPGQPMIYERYRFINDSTIEITYFGDSALSRETGTGRIYFAAGRIFHAFGSRRWGATRLDKEGAFFAPDGNARSTFLWAFNGGRNSWTSTLRSGAGGRETVTVFSMRRLR